MVLFNYALKELTAKIVYYGPGLSGKTTNLQYIYEELPIKNKGRMLTLATETDRTLYFDFLPVEAGVVRGIKTRIQLYTVPGQVYYNATRQMVLKGADGVVFVADSQAHMMEANHESMANLRENLLAHDLKLEELPLVLQYNKRDLPDVLSLDEMNDQLNPMNIPFYEAIAVEGIGVEDTLRAISNLVLKSVIDKYGGAQKPSAAAARASVADPHATTAPSFGAGWKSKEATDPFGADPSLLKAPASSSERRTDGASPGDDVLTFPALLADRKMKKEQQAAELRDIFEELNLEEMLGEALGPGSGEPLVAPVSEAEARDLVEGLDIDPPGAAPGYASVIEEALQVENDESMDLMRELGGDGELAPGEEIVIFDEESISNKKALPEPPTPMERPATVAASAEILRPVPRSAAAAVEVELQSGADLNSDEPRRVLVPIQLTIDRDAEELELEITLQIRVSRTNRN